MRISKIGLAALGICLSANAAHAADRQHFDIPPGPLGDTLIRFGEQAGLSVGVNDPVIARSYSRGVRGTFTARRALARLLTATHYGFVWIDAQTVRIIVLPARRRGPQPPPSPSGKPDTEALEIIVTATKQASNLADYPGAVTVAELDRDDPALRTPHGITTFLARLPNISSTSLGPGRDKLFIRGIADSSFTGPTQATVGQYLGDIRLTFNAPDPNLNLYDIQSVEILEGPQNTLYGSGTLGGILRIVPNAPDLTTNSATIQTGGTIVTSGSPGADVAAMGNVVLSDRLALRVVGYGSFDPGYINDPVRHLNDLNRGNSYGGRVTLRVAPDNGWTIDLGGTLQNIAAREGQYAIAGMPPLTRTSTLSQPFDNDYSLLSATIHKRWNDMELVSATGYVHHHVSISFDATMPGGTPRLFVEDDRLFLLSHETRLSGRTSGGIDWLAGFAGLIAGNRIGRLLGDPDAPVPITGVRNDNDEAALFGRLQIPLTPTLQASIGGRLSYSAAIGAPLDVPEEMFERRRHAWRMTPSLGFTWRVAHQVHLFFSYDEGYRAGGLAVARSGTSETTRSFLPDRMRAFQAGIRVGNPKVDSISGNLVMSRTRWTDIQADLIDSAGLPYTANIGSGRIDGIESNIAWSPVRALRISLAAFFNRDSLSDPANGIPKLPSIDLPNVADLGVSGTVSYRRDLGSDRTLALDASVRHTGRSRLGPPPDLYIGQGRFWEASAGGRLDLGRFGLSLDVTNLFNGRGNRFSFGNPFTVRLGNQVTPLQPRSFRFGVDARF